MEWQNFIILSAFIFFLIGAVIGIKTCIQTSKNSVISEGDPFHYLNSFRYYFCNLLRPFFLTIIVSIIYFGAIDYFTSGSFYGLESEYSALCLFCSLSSLIGYGLVVFIDIMIVVWKYPP